MITSLFRLKLFKAITLILAFPFLQACNLAASEINPDPEVFTSNNICGMRFIRGCDGTTPLYDEAAGMPVSNVPCEGLTLDATCSEIIMDDGEGPYSLWTVSAVTCPADYTSVKLGSPVAVNNVNFTCLRN